MITKAVLKDASEIQKLINAYAKKGKMLAKSIVDICETIRDFYVYREKGKVAGACALSICWGDLAEIRSLAVDSRHAKKGMGSRLVDACLQEAGHLGVKKVFVLTYIPAYFKKFGFKRVKRDSLPQKIWKDCINCPKFPDCGETPMIREVR
jgi:amino-acid N-acetyltransferase